MLKILFDLTTELNEEAILVSNGDTELCFFREDKPILLNNEYGAEIVLRISLLTEMYAICDKDVLMEWN